MERAARAMVAALGLEVLVEVRLAADTEVAMAEETVVERGEAVNKPVAREGAMKKAGMAATAMVVM